MKACGLIVEYNPLHNGHVYHIQEAKKLSKATCMIAIMSGSFLQRGEPAIIDKFHRTESALTAGIDILIELPYLYGVQSSKYFAKGAVRTLDEVGVSSICFGSESGLIKDFITSFELFKANESAYTPLLKEKLKEGLSFPAANEYALKKLRLETSIDLSKPNNILGYSYVSTILDNDLSIDPLTIKRTNSDFHDETITSSIASATSIRKEISASNSISPIIKDTIPDATIKQLRDYKKRATTWHTWESYFLLLHYRVTTMSLDELASIHGVDEGLEYRIKQTAKNATSFNQWMQAIKTKRYTWTRLQRMFTHILTNTKKTDMRTVENADSVPYIRLLGLTKTGQAYLNKYKKEIKVPIITTFHRDAHPVLMADEKASNAYYSILPPKNRLELRKQEIQRPIFV